LWLGDWPEACAAAQRAEAQALACESQRGRALAATCLGYAYAYTQQWPLALQATRRGLEASTEPLTLAHALWISGFVQAGGGEPQKAIGELQLVIEQLEAHGMRAQSGHARVALAAAFVRAGDAQRALQVLVDALEISRGANDQPGLGAGLRVRGQAALALQDWERARASLDEAMQVFRRCGARIEIANTWAVQAELARATGDGASAREYLEQARRLYLQCGADRAAAQLPVAYDAPSDGLMTASS
jgi:tetratricopeptide (TPR) repeat protein